MTRGAVATTEIPPVLQIEEAPVDPADIGDRRREALRDEKTEVEGIAFPVDPIEPLGSVEAGPLIADEIAEDDARSMREPSNWGLKAIGGENEWCDGQSATVAVINSGIRSDHVAFRGVKIVPLDFTGGKDVCDHSGHGTHCAATIIGRRVGDRRIGVAPGVSCLIVARIFAPEFNPDAMTVYEALQRSVDKGADVVSMSLSFNVMRCVRSLEKTLRFPTEAAVAMAAAEYHANLRLFEAFATSLRALEETPRGRGAVIVAAAGNHSRRKVAEEGQAFWVPAAPPSSALGAISVGALRRYRDQLAIASYSNAGPSLVAPGSGIVSADARSKDGLVAMSGTSMACPHVAGLAARWWDAVVQGPARKKAGTVVTRLLSSAIVPQFGEGAGRGDDHGFGVPRAPKRPDPRGDAEKANRPLNHC